MILTCLPHPLCSKGVRSLVLTASTMLPLGTPLPVAAMQAGLRPVTGGPFAAAALDGRHVEEELTRLQHDLNGRVALIGICSNSTLSHPQDGPAGMAAQALACRWTFPYLQDPDQGVARSFRAACTPDPFLFDAGDGLACDGRDLRAALAALLEGRPVPEPQRPAIGCNIKWHCS